MNIDLFNGARKKVVSGCNTLFWEDCWCKNSCKLKDTFPRLFALEKNQRCRINERWVEVDGSWSAVWDWVSQPRGRAIDELDKLLELLSNIRLQNGKADSWVWHFDSSGVFSSKGMYSYLVKAMYGGGASRETHFWLSWVPSKVNICIWRARLDRLPTLANLGIRGVSLGSNICALCDNVTEILDHILFKCDSVKGLWKKVCTWWGLKSDSVLGWDHELLGKKSGAISDNLFKLQVGVGYVVIWHIWRRGNNIVFADTAEEKKNISSEDLFSFIQRSSLLWIKHRCKGVAWNWNSWVTKPTALFQIGDL